MISENLRKTQLVELLILDYFDDFCTKHNLKYFLIGGTLLGAVRHGGFIPWDDDIDVAMESQDYEKFCELFPKQGDFILQNIKTTGNLYFKYFSKIRLKGTRIEEERIKGFPIDKGIFIDIFPLYFSTKPSSILLYFRRRFVDILYSIRLIKLGLLGTKNLLKKKLSKLMSFRLIDFLAIKFMEGCLTKSKYLTYFGFYGHNKETMLRSIYGYSTKLKFENKKYSVPKDYVSYLKNVYGDYLTLPPLKDQKPSHSKNNVSLGKYENIRLVDGEIYY